MSDSPQFPWEDKQPAKPKPTMTNAQKVGLGVAVVVVAALIFSPKDKGASNSDCKDTSASIVSLFNDNLKPNATPIISMQAVEADTDNATIFSGRSVWFVVSDDGAAWATGMNPFGGDQEGVTVPMNGLARSVSNIGVDVPSTALGSLASDPALDSALECS